MSKVIKFEVSFECPPGFVYADAAHLKDFVSSAIMRAMHEPSINLMNLKTDTVETRVLMVVDYPSGMIERKRLR